MFIEKAILQADNPLLFNSENMTYNQVLTNSEQLRDNSGCAWLVGYYAKNATGLSGSVPANNILEIPSIAITQDIYDKLSGGTIVSNPTTTGFMMQTFFDKAFNQRKVIFGATNNDWMY